MPKLHLYLHTPTPVFKARVNMASATYPIASLTYDTVTLGAYTDIEFDSTLLLGTTEGADDLGRVRVQKPADASTIYVSRSSRGIEDGQLDVQDGAYITVLDDFRVWARLPYFDLDAGIDFKDGDVPVGDFNTELPPIANCGSGFADYIDPDTEVITVTFPNDGVNLSQAMADGATITTYNWDVKDGTITVGTSSDAAITATFPAGFRYVGLTVTDSNGKQHSARCPVLAVDKDNDVTIKGFRASQNLQWRGQTLDLEIFDELSRADYPDGTLVLFWWDSPATSDSREHMKFVGWVSGESYSIMRRKEGRTSSLSLHCLDVAGRLSELPGFPQALSRIEDESPWSYMPSLDMGKALWYLLFWHSTAVNLADFVLPADGDDYDAVRLDSGAASLFDQADGLAQKMVPDFYLTCNSKGQLIFQEDWRLKDVGDRPTSAPIITEDYWNDLSFEYNRHPKVHVLRSGAFLVQTELNEEDDLDTVYSIAPSDAEAFGQGLQEQVEGEGLTFSQEALNKNEGHRYAMLNSRYGDFSLRDPSGYAFWDYEPALFNRVQLNIPAGYARQRGLDFTTASGIIKSMAVQYQTDKRGTYVSATAVWNKETSGYPALTHVPEEIEDVDYVPPPPTTPPDFGLVEGVQKVAAIDSFTLGGTNLFRTNDFQTPSGSGGPTWEAIDLGITDGFLKSFVVDPFSPGYINQDGTGAVNGWAVGDQNVWRIEDMFGLTPSASVVYTFAYTISNDNNQGRTIQASFGRYFETEEDNPWLIVISHYGVHNDRPGTWCIYSQDAGATWSNEVLVSALFDEGATSNGPLNNTGLYLSPKTPGLAYATAYTISSGDNVMGFQSTDWGATWTQMAGVAENPDTPLPGWGVYSATPATGFEYHGQSSSFTFSNEVSDSGDVGGSTNENATMLLFPPANAKKVWISGSYTATKERSNTDGIAFFGSVDNLSGTNLSVVEDFDQPNPDWGAVATDTFTAEITKSGTGDWPNNLDSAISSPPTGGSEGVGMDFNLTAQGVGAGATASLSLSITLTVTQIELDDGTIYVPEGATGLMAPGDRPSGALHVPWLNNNDEFIVYSSRLKEGASLVYRTLKATGDGTTLNDISPEDGATTFAPQGYNFGIRTYDPDPSYVAMGGVGNSTSADMDDNVYAVFVSDDLGVTWTKILEASDSTVFSYYTGYNVAFGADNPSILFIWGPRGVDGTDPMIAYTSDFGTTVDDRSGNLFALVGSDMDGFIGIAGGPIGG